MGLWARHDPTSRPRHERGRAEIERPTPSPPQFENASQLVAADNVDVASVPVGFISEISLADDNQALVP